MKLFVLKLKLPKKRVQRFARELLKNARVVGITLSGATRAEEDPEDSNDDHVFVFICQAPTSLRPEQIIATMALCEMCKGTILSLGYTEADEEIECGDKIYVVPTLPAVRLIVDNTEK